MERTDDAEAPPARPTHLRLVWSQPAPRTAARAIPPRVTGPPPFGPPAVPRWRVNLALAIERQLRGDLGLSDDEFLEAFSRRP